MKFSAVALVGIIGSAVAGRPQLSINIRDGSFGGLSDGLEPTLTWEDSAKSGDIDLSYGVKSAALPTTDIASLPKSIWGKASLSSGSWKESVQANVDTSDMSTAALEIDAVNEDDDLSLKVLASASSDGVSVSNVEATKGFDLEGAYLSVNPRYNVGTEEADVVVKYENGDTDVELTASRDSQSVTISQQIDDDNRIAPTISSGGAISLEWERSLGDGNSLTTTLKPNESVDLEWNDASWTANINLPVDGTSIGGANVSIKRQIDL